jgi:hypothetical protein
VDSKGKSLQNPLSVLPLFLEATASTQCHSPRTRGDVVDLRTDNPKKWKLGHVVKGGPCCGHRERGPPFRHRGLRLVQGNLMPAALRISRRRMGRNIPKSTLARRHRHHYVLSREFRMRLDIFPGAPPCISLTSRDCCPAGCHRWTPARLFPFIGLERALQGCRSVAKGSCKPCIVTCLYPQPDARLATGNAHHKRRVSSEKFGPAL